MIDSKIIFLGDGLAGVFSGGFFGRVVSGFGSGLTVADIWAMPTEALGSAKEAHRQWPEGRSEQGASNAKEGPRMVERCRAFSGTPRSSSAPKHPERSRRGYRRSGHKVAVCRRLCILSKISGNITHIL